MRSRITVSGLFVAIGLILPYFTAHAFGMPGVILLPMHIPVILCGLLCGPQFGALCGIIIPVLSCILTGMPAPYPMLPVMTVQLYATGLMSGLMYNKFKCNIYLSMFTAMISGWVLYGLVFAFLLYAGSGGFRVLSVTAAIVTGFPGIIIQLILIPAIMAVIRKNKLLMENPAAKADHMLSKALRLINNKKKSFVIIKGGAVIHADGGHGVAPLLTIYQNEPEKIENAFVTDKIIGKAAAVILVAGGAKRAYGIVMSAAGCSYLQRHNIMTEYGRLVEVMSNRDNSGICPFEAAVMSIDSPQEGIAAITKTLEIMQNLKDNAECRIKNAEF